MKKLSKLLAFILVLVLAFSVAACGNKDKGGGDVELDDSGNVRPIGGQETKITFWGYGDENEISVFNSLVEQFNKMYEGSIQVEYEAKGNDDYSTSAYTALQQSKARVDILYVGDADFKRFAELGYLEPLDNYLKTSSEVKVEEMWEKGKLVTPCVSC